MLVPQKENLQVALNIGEYGKGRTNLDLYFEFCHDIL